MKIKTPLTKARVRNHFTYYFWIYLLAGAAAVFGWDLLYTMTAYRSPENKRIDIYIQTGTVTEEGAKAFLQPVWEEYVPDMETVQALLLSPTTEDYYSSMQLSVYLMAQEGDIYLLKSSDFKNYASQGVFLDLQSYVEDGSLELSDIDLSAGYVALMDDNGLPTGERKLFGIPLYTLYGYMEGMMLDNRDLVLGVTVYNQNDENVIKFLNGFIQAGRGEKPDWLKEQ